MYMLRRHCSHTSPNVIYMFITDTTCLRIRLTHVTLFICQARHTRGRIMPPYVTLVRWQKRRRHARKSWSSKLTLSIKKPVKERESRMGAIFERTWNKHHGITLEKTEWLLTFIFRRLSQLNMLEYTGCNITLVTFASEKMAPRFWCPTWTGNTPLVSFIFS